MSQAEASARAEYAEELAENARQAAHNAHAMAELAMEAARLRLHPGQNETAARNPLSQPGLSQRLTPLENPFTSPGDMPPIPLPMLKHALVGQLHLHFDFQAPDIKHRQKMLVDKVMHISRWMQHNRTLPATEYHRYAAQLAYMVYAITHPPSLEQPFGPHTIRQRQLSVLEVVTRFCQLNGIRWELDGEPVYHPSRSGAGRRRRWSGSGASGTVRLGSSDGGSPELVRYDSSGMMSGANGVGNSAGGSAVSGPGSSAGSDAVNGVAVNGDGVDRAQANGTEVNGNHVNGNGLNVNGANGNHGFHISNRSLNHYRQSLVNGTNGNHRSRRANGFTDHDDEPLDNGINGRRSRRRAIGFLSEDETSLPNGVNRSHRSRRTDGPWSWSPGLGRPATVVNDSPSSRRARDFWSHDNGRPANRANGSHARWLARYSYAVSSHGDERHINGAARTNGVNGHVANGDNPAYINGLTNAGDHGASGNSSTDDSSDDDIRSFLRQLDEAQYHTHAHHNAGDSTNRLDTLLSGTLLSRRANERQRNASHDHEPRVDSSRSMGRRAQLARMINEAEARIDRDPLRELSLSSFFRDGHFVGEEGVDDHAANGVNGHLVNGVNGHAVNGINGHAVNGINGTHHRGSSDGGHYEISDTNGLDDIYVDMTTEEDLPPLSPPLIPLGPVDVLSDEHDGLTNGVNGDFGH